MKYSKSILIFTILACVLLVFSIYGKEKIIELNNIAQEQKQEADLLQILAIANSEHSTLKNPSYINGYEVYKTIDTSKDFTIYAKKSMLEYLAGLQDMTFEEYLQEYKEYKPYEYVYGFEFDLNDSGKNEIIGFQFNACESVTCSGQILQKQNGKWKNIGNIEFGPGTIIEILQNKTNGYHDIRTLPGRSCGGRFDVSCYSEIKRFENGGYNFTMYAKDMIKDIINMQLQ